MKTNKNDIIAAYKKGFGKEAIAKLLKIKIEDVEAVIDDKEMGFSKENLRTLANQVLFDLLNDIKASPSAYKPAEIINAAKEALDRTDGKAAQSIAVENKTTIEHKHLISLPPNEAYQRLIRGDKIIDMPSK